MRQAQVGIFALGLASFLVAVFFMGQTMGDILWRAGVAAMLVDMVSMKLWSSPKL